MEPTARFDDYLGIAVHVEMDDGTVVAGTPDAYAGGQIWFGWIAVPVMRITNITKEQHAC